MLGYLHSFESMAAVDGDGLRCAVFLAGCPLRCVFCHNPDTWERGERQVTPEEVVKKVSRYKPYFGADGGVTFTGGEPLLQAPFLQETVPLLKKEEISYILDTSGAVALTEEVKFVLKESQSVLLDLKFWDDESYLTYTGRSMEKTMALLRYLNGIGKRVVVRTVILPGINDREEILDRYLALLEGLSCITYYELLPFHTMGFSKYEKMQIPNPLEKMEGMNVERCQQLQKYVNEKRKPT